MSRPTKNRSYLPLVLRTVLLANLFQVLLLLLVVAQIFIAAQPARHYWRFLDDLASTSFGGYSKQPWLYIELPVFGVGAEGGRIPGMHMYHHHAKINPGVKIELLQVSCPPPGCALTPYSRQAPPL